MISRKGGQDLGRERPAGAPSAGQTIVLVSFSRQGVCELAEKTARERRPEKDKPKDEKELYALFWRQIDKVYLILSFPKKIKARRGVKHP